MANHMAEVAKIFGVELGEKFKIDGDSLFSSKDEFNKYYYFTKAGLIADSTGCMAELTILFDLIYGVCTIKREPWKPKADETYWYVDAYGDVWKNNWNVCGYPSDHMNRYKLGNCYRTRGEAEANRDKWIKFYKSDEVLEV